MSNLGTKLTLKTHMREFQEKRITKKRIYSRWAILTLLLLFCISIKGMIGAYSKVEESQVEVERVQKAKNDLQKRYEVINSQSDLLKSDIGVETEIRSKFDVVKEGEGVIVVVEKDVPAIQEDKRGVLRKFWDGVKGSVKGVFSPAI